MAWSWLSWHWNDDLKYIPIEHHHHWAPYRAANGPIRPLLIALKPPFIMEFREICLHITISWGLVIMIMTEHAWIHSSTLQAFEPHEHQQGIMNSNLCINKLAKETSLQMCFVVFAKNAVKPHGIGYILNFTPIYFLHRPLLLKDNDHICEII